MGLVVDGFAGGDGFGGGDLVGVEADGDGGFAAALVALADHLSLVGREFESAHGQQLVPELGGRVSGEPIGGFSLGCEFGDD